MVLFALEVPNSEVFFFNKLIESLSFVRRMDTPATKSTPTDSAPWPTANIHANE